MPRGRGVNDVVVRRSSELSPLKRGKYVCLRAWLDIVLSHHSPDVVLFATFTGRNSTAGTSAAHRSLFHVPFTLLSPCSFVQRHRQFDCPPPQPTLSYKFFLVDVFYLVRPHTTTQAKTQHSHHDEQRQRLRDTPTRHSSRSRWRNNGELGDATV